MEKYKREICLNGCRYVYLEFEKLGGPFGRSFTPEQGYFLTIERMGHGAMQIDVSDHAVTNALKKAAMHDALVDALDRLLRCGLASDSKMELTDPWVIEAQKALKLAREG